MPRIKVGDVNIYYETYGNGKPFLVRLIGSGLLKPKHKIPGVNIAGRVEAVGRDVKQFQQGDEVFGDLSDCGLCVLFLPLD